MKRLLIAILLLVLAAGCTKKSSQDNWEWDWSNPIAIGRKFNYYNMAKLQAMINDSVILEGPFTVDSVAYKAFDPYNGYWVSDKHKVKIPKALDPLVIRSGLIK